MNSICLFSIKVTSDCTTMLFFWFFYHIYHIFLCFSSFFGRSSMQFLTVSLLFLHSTFLHVDFWAFFYIKCPSCMSNTKYFVFDLYMLWLLPHSWHTCCFFCCFVCNLVTLNYHMGRDFTQCHTSARMSYISFSINWFPLLN